MDMQEKIALCVKLLAEYEEEKKTDPDAVFDVSKLPIDIEVMKAFVKAHEEVKQKMAASDSKGE